MFYLSPGSKRNARLLVAISLTFWVIYAIISQQPRKSLCVKVRSNRASFNIKSYESLNRNFEKKLWNISKNNNWKFLKIYKKIWGLILREVGYLWNDVNILKITIVIDLNYTYFLQYNIWIINMTLKQFQNVSKMVKIVVYVKCVNVVCKEKFQKKYLLAKKL